MKLYELTYLVSAELSPEQMETLSKKISSLILENGEIIGLIAPDKKNLTYPIKKQNAALLSQVKFNFEPELIDKFKKEINKEKEILRIMLIEKKNMRIKKKSRNSILEPKLISEDIKTPAGRSKQKDDLDKIEEKLDEILK
jgi:ribosomal protein S6